MHGTALVTRTIEPVNLIVGSPSSRYVNLLGMQIWVGVCSDIINKVCFC